LCHAIISSWLAFIFASRRSIICAISCFSIFVAVGYSMRS
jgi:hypothetical protein